jgi:ABC-type nickel/cobalt efflux system permease component RcnA
MLRTWGIILLVAAAVFAVLGFIGIDQRPANASNSLLVWTFIAAGICGIFGIAMLFQAGIAGEHPWTKHSEHEHDLSRDKSAKRERLNGHPSHGHA